MPDPTPRPVPRGPAAAFTDDQLDDLAAITPADLDRAARTFRRDAAGTGYGGLLDAEPREGDADD